MKHSVAFEDIREGDIVSLRASTSYNGKRYVSTLTGEAFANVLGDLFVYTNAVIQQDFIYAYREKVLPTEPGSVIRNVKTLHRQYNEAVLDKNGFWRTATPGHVLGDIPVENIQDWEEF